MTEKECESTLNYVHMLDKDVLLKIYKKATILSETYIERLSTKTILSLSVQDYADVLDISYFEAYRELKRAKSIIQSAIRKHIDSFNYKKEIDPNKLYNEILAVYYLDYFGWNKYFQISRDSYLDNDEQLFYENHIDNLLLN